MANSRMTFCKVVASRMPPHIQTFLSASSEPLDKLAIIADKVSEVVGSSSTICAATTVSPPSQSSSCSVQPTMDSRQADPRAAKSDKCSPRQIRQLDFISQFTTNIVHIPGSDNIAADVLSRVSAITFPSQIDYDCIAETQQTDQELHTLIASGTSLELKKVTFPNSSTEIMCDLSTGTARPYIPKQHRQDVFSAMHNLSHPGIRRSVHLMKQRFVWPSISSDVAKWARHCLACQKSKIHRHTRSPLSSFQEPSQRFDHVHLDLIGPLPIKWLHLLPDND
ncbi:integrase catalytic domain-containing protein [Trichonephila clavipes]|nr:integrase catalytic domain-containing protein [Trichonephila clavipes]